MDIHIWTLIYGIIHMINHMRATIYGGTHMVVHIWLFIYGYPDDPYMSGSNLEFFI